MLVDPDGVGITQRETARLTQLTARPRPGGLRLSAPGQPDLDLDEPVDGPEEFVRVFRSKPPVPARVAEKAWTSEFLGRDARLVWQADPGGRTIGEIALDSDRVGLADGYPLLLANEASLEDLNGWLGDDAVPMTRFRPNLVVDGATAWAEDTWIGQRLRVGEVMFRAAKSCARCVVTTIDQETGIKSRQPLRALGTHRRYADGLLFAINLIPDTTGTVSVGDEMTVVAPGEHP